MIRNLRNFAGIIGAILFSLFAFYLFSRVGHLAGPYFKILSLLEFAGAFLFVFFFHRLRYFAAGFAIFALPRGFSILLGRDSHNLLFCIFAGMALALVARSRLKAHESRPATRSSFAPEAGLLLLFVIFLILRGLVEFYAPSILNDLTLRDRRLPTGVSANYAFYLCLLVGLNLLGPLLFIIADAKTGNLSAPEDNTHSSIARGLLAGFALGGVVCLGIVGLQEMGVKRLFAGSARSLEHLRPPGSFTDSGSAAVLLPPLLYCIYLFVSQRWNGRPLLRKLTALLLILIALFMAVHQGRGYILSLAGLVLCLSVIYFFQSNHRRPLISVFFAGLILLPLMLWAAAGWVPAAKRLILELSEVGDRLWALEPAAAYARLDPVRANLFRAGLDVFQKNAAVGSGLNSFMVQTAPLVQAGRLVADNPSTLFIGILSDTGVLGTLFLFSLTIPYGVHLVRLFREGAELSFRVYALPLFCLPTFFIGYHVVFPEFCAFLLVPMLFWPHQHSSRSLSIYSSVALLALYMTTTVIVFISGYSGSP